MRKLALGMALALSMFAAPGHAQATHTWTNAGGGNCLSILTIDGQPASPGQVYCPNQSTSFVSPDGGASLYMGDDILEASFNYVQRGAPQPTSYNADGTIHTYTTTDTFTIFGDTVTAVQNFIRTYGVRCASRSGCHKYYYDTNVGGSGTLIDSN
jgi:hypothetical protein